MDTNENGKISKHEWMKFMEAEFDRLDKDKKGQLDAKGTNPIEMTPEDRQAPSRHLHGAERLRLPGIEVLR